MTAVLSQESSLRDDLDRIIKTESPERPGELPCEVHHIKVKGESYFVLVGMYNNDPL